MRESFRHLEFYTFEHVIVYSFKPKLIPLITQVSSHTKKPQIQSSVVDIRKSTYYEKYISSMFHHASIVLWYEDVVLKEAHVVLVTCRDVPKSQIYLCLQITRIYIPKRLLQYRGWQSMFLASINRIRICIRVQFWVFRITQDPGAYLPDDFVIQPKFLGKLQYRSFLFRFWQRYM